MLESRKGRDILEMRSLVKASFDQLTVVGMKRICLAYLLACCVICTAAAVDIDLVPIAQAGSGQARGDYFDIPGGQLYEAGRNSWDDAEYSPYFPILLGGGGVDLAISNGRFFLVNGNRALVTGFELGTYGGAIQVENSDGDAFASSQIRSLVLAIHVDERFRFPLGGRSFISLSAGPILGVNCAYYRKDLIEGIKSKLQLTPQIEDYFVFGAGLGVDYGIKLWRGQLLIGLRGDMLFTPLSSSDGVLGGKVALPWRALGRIGYEIPLGGSRRASHE
jgi:hypothetical protein